MVIKQNKENDFNISKEEGENIEKKLAKKAVSKKKTTVKKKLKTSQKDSKKSKGQTKKTTTKKKEEKSNEEENKKTASDSKTFQDIVDEYPDWFIELFEYVDKLDGIDVLKQDKEESPKKRTSSFTPKEMERKLFLIFMASPKKYRNKKEGIYKRILQKEFSEIAGVSENSLSDWKSQGWFKDNLPLVMREIFKMRTPDVLNALYDGATTNVNEWGKKDAAAIKLWLEYIEGFKPGVDVTSGGEKVEVYFGNGNVGKSQFINKNENKGESKQ